MSLATKGYQILREEGPLSFALEGTKYVIRKIRKQIYRIGSSVVCPVCGFSGRAFLPVGKRRESMCPRCGAKERHRLLWYYITNKTGLTEGGNRILYFAPTGEIMHELSKNNNIVITTDLTMDSVDVNADITRLPFDDGAFDAIICSHVLEHISDDCAAMCELRRVLAPKGDALIMIPKDKDREYTFEDDSIITPEERYREFGQSSHVRVYGRDFVDRLSESGFDVEVATYANSLGPDIVDKHGMKVRNRNAYFGPAVDEEPREKYEDIHHCTKAGD